MKAAIYNRYWQSMGGGERHSAAIAEVMAKAGVEVDLVSHLDFDIDELSSRLALDLTGVKARIIPDLGDEETSLLTADYDLLINGTYMSRLASRARRSVYVCFFPTPPTHELKAWQTWTVDKLGPRLEGAVDSQRRNGQSVIHGTGWFPTEGGRRRRYAWSNGSGILLLPAGDDATVLFKASRMALAPVEVTVENKDGQVLTTFTAGSGFQTYRIEVPADDEPRAIMLRSATDSPGPDDSRQLGFAMTLPRVASVRPSVAQLAVQRFPWLSLNPHQLEYLKSYDLITANSEYTQGWISKLWHRDSELLFPPIDVKNYTPALLREKTILSVGRFFKPGVGHAKRQLEMVQIFAELHRSGQLPDWKLVLVGGCEDHQRPYLQQVQAAAEGLPVTIHANAPRSLVNKLMSTSSIYWSATGLGQDPNKKPWAMEHFGMTTVEAMAGGCVPVVIDQAGQREIVREGVDGFRWSNPDECRIRTVQVATNPALRERLAASAIERSKVYSEDAFAKQWWELSERYDLLPVNGEQGV